MRDRNDSRPAVALQERARCRTLSDTELVVAMRGDEPYAFHEFIDRFRAAAWAQARDLGVGAHDRKSWAEELLHDCALTLARGDVAIPATVGGYVVTATRRKYFQQLRKDAARDRLLGQLLEDSGSNETSAVDDRGDAPPDAVIRLIHRLLATITPVEELILTWKGEKITYTTMAGWLGMTRLAAAQKTWRLTKRLQLAAATIIDEFTEEERAVIRKVLDRVTGGEP